MAGRVSRLEQKSSVAVAQPTGGAGSVTRAAGAGLSAGGAAASVDTAGGMGSRVTRVGVATVGAGGQSADSAESSSALEKIKRLTWPQLHAEIARLTSESPPSKSSGSDLVEACWRRARELAPSIVQALNIEPAQHPSHAKLSNLGKAIQRCGSACVRRALSEGDLARLEVLVKLGLNLNELGWVNLGEEPIPPLARALLLPPEKAREAVALLVENGADVNASWLNGQTLLMYVAAAENGSAASVQLLLDRGAKVEATDSRGWSALDYAKQLKNDEICLLLEKAGAKSVQGEQTDLSLGGGPTAGAGAGKSADCATVLAAMVGTGWSKNTLECIPTWFFSKTMKKLKKQLQVVERLKQQISAGPSLDIASSVCRAYWQRAVELYPDVAKALRREAAKEVTESDLFDLLAYARREGHIALHEAIQKEEMQRLELLIGSGSDLNAGHQLDSADEWRLPLIRAVYMSPEKAVTTVSLLLKKKGSLLINQLDSSGYTALDHAEWLKSEQVCRILKEDGAKRGSTRKSASRATGAGAGYQQQTDSSYSYWPQTTAVGAGQSAASTQIDATGTTLFTGSDLYPYAPGAGAVWVEQAETFAGYQMAPVYFEVSPGQWALYQWPVYGSFSNNIQGGYDR
jgi:ankyrin repeat protein